MLSSLSSKQSGNRVIPANCEGFHRLQDAVVSPRTLFHSICSFLELLPLLLLETEGLSVAVPISDFHFYLFMIWNMKYYQC